ncbi:ABC transporter permease [Flavilitoribacter nigricans]|uniref:ABC transporter permease n=1 Tax=Flavilitoribacter nigricans (strain ATCC 23147 / DSM 23189 / NBRC 102662 / NCIMB 1420 / SS-2) TaxID=1122177 RepID=A0A2D0NBD5_FLAN2|nr:ABC transporter permease [Flavilitoribacter nigricans]PHN05073.1 hypothetical protein CRP01_18790 [Flavilitoribacter nigricans DSM 23189 = NBRC 102662]
MLFHYSKILLRTLWRNKTYTALNLLGLTVGMIAFLLIMLYVQYEISFDQHNAQKDRIYRVIKREVGNAYFGTDYFAVTPAPLAPTLQEEFPEVEAATRIFKKREVLLSSDRFSALEPAVYGLAPETFDIFTFTAKAGDLASFRSGNSAAVLSASYARKYFGDADPIGQTLRYKGDHAFTVVGVIEDMPANAHFRMDVMVDFTTLAKLENRSLGNWQSSSFFTYFLLDDRADPDKLAAKLPELIGKYISPNEEESSTQFHLQPLLDIHLHSTANFDIGPTSDSQNLYIYALIAFLILLIACINYINLSTARSFRRAREVGIRKTVGAHKSHLILQFLGESFALSLGALVIAYAAVSYLLPGFSRFVGSELSLAPWKDPWLLPALTAIFGAVGLLSGAYPALVLSSFNPVSALKGKLTGNRRSALRNVLVVTQFAVSAGLVISTLIITRQLKFIQEKDMGYQRDQIMVINLPDPALMDDLPVLKAELAKIPEVRMVSSASSMPNSINSNSGAQWPGKPNDVDIMLYGGYVDYDYTKLFELELVAGRHFSREYGDESKSVLLNESAARALGWEEPLGKNLISWSGDTATVVGILKDFHQHSLHLSIAPLQLFFKDEEYQLAVKVSGSQLEETIGAIESTYKQFSRDYPFDYRLFDEVFAAAYTNDQKTATMANWFTLLIILIACLGLYGLSAFTTEMRIKEVGIRKVLGASVSSLIILLSRQYLSLVLLSFVIAIPLAYWVMSEWLNNFVYHISIGATIFLWTFFAMIAITLLTVGYKTFMAAIRRPVDAISTE